MATFVCKEFSSIGADEVGRCLSWVEVTGLVETGVPLSVPEYAATLTGDDLLFAFGYGALPLFAALPVAYAVRLIIGLIYQTAD